MKSLDTNILVRLLVNDDQAQTQIVYDLFKKAEIEKEIFYISHLVILELIWVLDSVYEINRTNLVEAIHQLTLMPLLQFEDLTIINKFVQESKKTNIDLADLMIATTANHNGCEKTITFDKKAAKCHLFELL